MKNTVGMKTASSTRSRPAGRFLASVAVLTGLFLLAYREELLGRLLAPVSLLTAASAAELLEWLGFEVVRSFCVLAHPGGFAYEVYYRCTGVLPAAIFTLCLAAYPAPLKYKALGIACGVPLLLALNLVRLVHLFYLGVSSPKLFSLAHGILWEVVLIGATLGLFWLWQRRPSKGTRDAGHG
jgi:exosortase/archaeosortase family protein